MLLDVAKYLFTVGLISGLLTHTLAPFSGLVIAIVIVILVIMGFYIIPPHREDQ